MDQEPQKIINQMPDDSAPLDGGEPAFTPPPGPGPQPNRPGKYPAVWKIYLAALVVANILTIVLPWVVLIWAAGEARAGMSGTEYLGMAIAPLLLAGFGVALVNVISLPIILIRRRLGRRGVLLSTLVIILSLSYLGYVGSSIASSVKRNREFDKNISAEEAVSLINSCSVSGVSRNGRSKISLKHSREADYPYDYWRYISNDDFPAAKTAAEAAGEKCGEINVYDSRNLPNTRVKEDISVEQAAELLDSCAVIGFYYTAQNSDKQGENAEASSTGIVLAYQDNPIRIHIADRHIEQLVPLARAAQTKCPKLQFWHDGNYEQPDGMGGWR